MVAGAATVITLQMLLPLKFLRVLSGTVLACMKSIALKPAAGTAVDLSPLSHAGVIDCVNVGSASVQDGLREVIVRIGAATTQIEISRLNALQSTLGNMLTSAPVNANGSPTANGQLLGAFSFAYAQAGRVVRSNQAAVAVVAGIETESETSERSRVLYAKLTRPINMAEFADFLNCWVMICHACGLGNVLVLGAFLRDVVFDTIALKDEWYVAHELFLVYLEFVETSGDPTITIANVFTRGSQDTHMSRAIARADDHFRIFRAPTRASSGGGGGGGGGGGSSGGAAPAVKPWNGSYDNKSTSCCISFNIGRKEHPATSLVNGKCRYNHICDHFVTDKGPKGQCGGKHARCDCTNPKKCDAAV